MHLTRSQTLWLFTSSDGPEPALHIWWEGLHSHSCKLDVVLKRYLQTANLGLQVFRGVDQHFTSVLTQKQVKDM